MVIDDAEAGHGQFKSTEDVPPAQSLASSTLPTNSGRHHGTLLPADGLHVVLPHISMAAEIALAALSTLPTPILILSSMKTVLLANTAVMRLLGLDQDDVGAAVTDLLKGQTLSQLGIDMVWDGIPIWVSWEKFLDNLANGLQPAQEGESSPSLQSGDTTPIATPEAERGRPPFRNQTQKPQDTVVDVVISSHHDHLPQRIPPKQTEQDSTGPPSNLSNDHQYLDFRRTSLLHLDLYELNGTLPPKVTLTLIVFYPQPFLSLSQIISVITVADSSVFHCDFSGQLPAEQSNGVSFPPIAPPPQCSTSSTLTDFQKVLKMKNAMLRAIEIPLIAMWRDESVVFPNLAARKLLEVEADPTSDDSYDFKSRFRPWTADFSRELKEDTNPVVALCRTQQGFTNWKIGLLDEKTGKKSNFDVSGHPVYDERTGEFLAGLTTFKDVTEYTEQIAHKTAENEEQFRLICDMMPQMIFTTTPDGLVNYWSQRWYDYTGLTPANSLGLGWVLHFHGEDLPETTRKWQHSLATGEEYSTEYRCRRYDGQWRWMLGRALPLRDHKTGKILRWFGTCTDIQDIVDAKAGGQRSRQQLLDVLKHSQMTMWILDRELSVTFYEGDFVMGDPVKDRIIGSPAVDVVGDYLAPQAIDRFQDALARLLSGASDLEILENQVNSRWFRSKMVPLKGKTGPNGVEDQNYIAGVIIIGSDVTGLRRKEQENITLLANEAAAKEASKMKSSFLANMSHEIRTPIAGVLGMSELLMDTKLDSEQSEFAQNIQRSANSLLTVINDILDFSKIESGRLDIEEVQFSLGVVLRDVAKMLSFAARRKGLQFSSDISFGPSEDFILLGDPGRIRQILVNLLTNSIKFTSEGYVKMSSSILSETSDTVTVAFCVEDSGIGIEEEVKKRLFQPFSQADSSTARRFGGTGLGLTISKNLVDLMRGTILLDSKLDAGTRATFTIPFKKVEYRGGSSAALLEVGSMPDRLQSDLSISITDSPNPEARSVQRTIPPASSLPTISTSGHHASVVGATTAPQTPVPEVQRDQIHILIVEDNPVNQQIALKFIKALKFSASAVWNGREALEYLLKATSPDLAPEQAKEYPLPSLILMDVQMPILDGYHTTHMLRHHAPFRNIEVIPRIPIVAMTASAIHGDREKCEKAGMDDYMAKPVKRSLLEKTILKWASRGRDVHRSQNPSEVDADSPKPPPGRACTDRSSTCTENDAIATEFYARNRNSDMRAGATEQAASTLGQSSPGAKGHAAARRSSISRAILETEIPGVESEADRAARRADAEDKARDLRYAKLLSATDLDRGQSIVAPMVAIGGSHSSNSQSSDLQTIESAAGTSPMALTEENVFLFNHAQDDAPVLPGTPSLGVGSEGLTYPASDIPGPPPEGTLAAIDLAHASANTEKLVSSILETAQLPTRPTEVVTVAADSAHSSPQNRRDVGGLAPESRQKSDWSTSTARPRRANN